MDHGMTEQLNVQQMAERLRAADNVLILCHKNPDGDTVGCGSALYYALKALDKNAAVLCSDVIPSRYAFTNPRLFKGEFEPQTVVAVDVAGIQLFGENNGVPSDFSKKFRQRSIVVFPLPLGPKMATTSPLFTSRSMLLSTCKSPKDLRRFLICSIVQLLCAPLLLRYRSPTACRRVSTVQNSR